MKHFALKRHLIYFLIIAASCTTQSKGVITKECIRKEDYKIYTGVLNTLFNTESRPVFILNDSTISAHSILDKPSIDALGESTAHEIVMKILQNNDQRCKFSNSFSSNLILLSQSGLQGAKDFWSEFRYKYPTGILISLSRISTDKECEAAAFQIRYRKGPLDGAGYLILLKKKKRKWEIISKRITSVS